MARLKTVSVFYISRVYHTKKVRKPTLTAGGEIWIMTEKKAEDINCENELSFTSFPLDVVLVHPTKTEMSRLFATAVKII